MDELKSLANILAHWIEPAPGVTVYLFGSRVRGTHHSGSDMDVRIFLNECVWCERSMQWWMLQNESGFEKIKSLLPGELKIHREERDDADKDIRNGRLNPILVMGNVVCVWTPPKPGTSSGRLGLNVRG